MQPASKKQSITNKVKVHKGSSGGSLFFSCWQEGLPATDKILPRPLSCLDALDSTDLYVEAAAAAAERHARKQHRDDGKEIRGRIRERRLGGVGGVHVSRIGSEMRHADTVETERRRGGLHLKSSSDSKRGGD